MPTPRRLAWPVAIAAVVAAAILVAGIARTGGHDVRAQVDVAHPGRPVPRVPLGLSVEWDAVSPYAGAPQHRNTDFARLVRALSAASGSPTALRVGGNSTDQSWWNPRGEPRPATVLFDITPATLRGLGWIARRTGAPVTLGVNLALDDPWRAAELVRAAQRRLPAGAVAAVEIGNEPDLFASSRTFRVGPRVLRRIRKRDRYSPADYEREVGSYLRTLSRLSPAPPLLIGGFSGSAWLGTLRDVVARERSRVGGITTHFYGLTRCDDPGAADDLTSRLLAPATTRAIAERAKKFSAIGATHGVPTYVTELNTAVCGGDPGVSDTFASALWLTDALFGLMDAGVARADVHSWPGSYYAPIDVRRHDGELVTAPRPAYYGMLLFARTATRGSRLARVRLADAPPSLRAWATTARDGTVRTAVLNMADETRTVRLRRPRASARCAKVERLRGAALDARDGVALVSDAPVCARDGEYVLRLRGAGGALLTIARAPDDRGS